jgi:hypothetical protein
MITHGICYVMDCASSSVSDSDHGKVNIRTFPYSIFNILAVFIRWWELKEISKWQ